MIFELDPLAGKCLIKKYCLALKPFEKLNLESLTHLLIRKSALFNNGGPDDQMEWFNGEVISERSDSFGSGHLCYEVEWESDKARTWHSKWELMPVGDHDITLMNIQQHSLNDKDTNRLSKIFDQIIKKNYEFHAFIDEVEPEYRAEYWKEIAYPTCLKQIKDRIDTKYYRCKEALEWEVDLIHKNCSAFNGNTDEQSNGLFRNVFKNNA